jgi:hypothetical protein
MFKNSHQPKKKKKNPKYKVSKIYCLQIEKFKWMKHI